MEWLTHNAIADMRGPDFLRFYAVVVVVTVLLSAWLFRLRDPTRLMSVPPVPPELDPYEVAYLRGGGNEVIRLLILDLIQRGYLERDSTGGQIRRSRVAPDLRHLAKFERAVLSWFHSSRTAEEIFKDDGLKGVVSIHCAPYDEKLHRENLLLPSSVLAFRDFMMLTGMAIILGLGGYKFAIALSKGRHNVGFLVAMAIVSSIILIALARALLPRASKRGREYLKKLRHVFDQVKARVAYQRSSSLNDDLLMLAGVYGIGVLDGTSYDYYPKMFKRAESSSGCGSGCGSSSSCGSGCGGGGGCGGCGS